MMKPLLEKNLIKYENLNWNATPATADPDDDEALFEDTDA